MLNGEKEVFEEICLVGDFNCDSSKGRYYVHFEGVVKNYNMSIVDIEKLNPESFTYVSRRDCCSTSWLDHVVASNPASISKFDLSVEDHISVFFCCHIPDIVCRKVVENDESHAYVLWNKLTELDKEIYSTRLDYFLNEYMNEAFSCCDQNCNSENHKKLIDEFYQFLCSAIFAASDHFQMRGNNRFNTVVGWNDICKELHKEARDNFLKWKDESRIRTGLVFERN